MEKTWFCYLTPSRKDMHKTVTPDEMRVFGEHTAFLKKHFEESRVLQAGTSFEDGQDHFALVIFLANDREDAVRFMNQDPAVANGQLKARVTEYDIFLERVFGEG